MAGGSIAVMNATRKGRIWLWLGVFVVVVFVLVVLAGQTRRQPAPQVLVSTVTRENLSSSISSNGKIEPIEPHTLQAKLTTFVEKTLVVEGHAVGRGQLLLTLDTSELRAELARAREELVAAEHELRVAQAGSRADEMAQLEGDLHKMEVELAQLRQERDVLARLLAQQAATRQELDQNKFQLDRTEAELRSLEQRRGELARQGSLNVESATLRVQRARAAISRLEEKIQWAQVTVPVAGLLYSLPVRAGNFVREGDALAELADLRQVRVRAFVDEPELGSLAENQEVEITWDAYPGRIWTGRVEQTPKSVVARGTRTVGEVLCSVDNEDLRLLPNVNVNVRIMVRKLTGALVVARAAVRMEGAGYYVFTVEGDRLRKRKINVGAASATQYEVLEGLVEGNRVALPGEAELRDDLVVRGVEQR